MAGEDESLLDVFVVLAAKGLQETEAEIDGFIARTKKKFGDAKALEIGDGVAARLKRELKEAAAVARQGAKEIAGNFNDVLAKLMRDERRDSSLTRGSSASGSQKVALAEAKHEVAAITYEFRKLSTQTDLTADDVKELALLFSRLQQAAVNVGEIRDQIISVGPQVNTLSNNAYQLGQAFEDAAIGFQLNGLAGAFRGASNNITFLIQNLSQSGALTSSLGEKAAKLIPLYAGIGAAIGFVVLPPLIEWLATLDDIDAKSKDIADLIKREFEDARFEVSLQIDQQDAVKAVRDAENAAEAIRLVIEQAQQSEKLTLQLTAELNNLARRQVIDDLNNVFDDVEKVIKERRVQVINPQIIPGAGPAAEPIIIPPDPKEVQKVENLNAALDVLRRSLDQVFEQSKKGIVDEGSTESARDAIGFINDNLDELKASGKISEEQFNNIAGALKAGREELEQIAEQAQRIVSINENLNRLLDEAKDKGEALSAEYEFQRAVNEGRLTEQDRFLFALQQQTEEIDRQNQKIKEQFGDNPLADKIIEQEEFNLKQRQEIDLTKEIRDINEKIADAKEKSAKASEEALKDQAEITKRIQKEQERGNERVANAQASLNDEIEEQARSKQEKLIQDRIDALQEAETQSRNFSLGDVGTIAFGPETKDEVERLQELLKQQRETQQQDADRERLRDLERRIIDERAASSERIAELQADAEEARQKEVEALENAKEEMEKLVDQLSQLNQALRSVQGGGDIAIPPIMEGGGRQLNIPFIPEVQELQRAQEQANAQALQNLDFKSSSLEGLTAQTNRILSTMNENLLSLDLQPRLV